MDSVLKIKAPRNDGVHTLYMALTPDLVPRFEEVFLLEMLTGERWEADGLVHYRIEISYQKVKALVDWWISTMPQQSKQ